MGDVDFTTLVAPVLFAFADNVDATYTPADQDVAFEADGK